MFIGARDMSFPRLNAFSYWMFLLSGVFLYVSMPLGQAPDAGWFAQHARAPLAVVPVAPAAGDQPVAFDIGMGVRRGDEALRAELDGVIRDKRRALDAILRRFGVPLVVAGAGRASAR